MAVEQPRVPHQMGDKLCKDSIEFPKRRQESAGFASFFSDFALEKSLLPFHVSGGRCAMEEPNHQPFFLPSRLLTHPKRNGKNLLHSSFAVLKFQSRKSEGSLAVGRVTTKMSQYTRVPHVSRPMLLLINFCASRLNET